MTFYLLQDIPSSGIECWYKLEGRTHRSNIQGKIRLKLWLSKRENRGTSEEEDNWSYIQQQERLYTIFINYEMTQASVSIIQIYLPNSNRYLFVELSLGEFTLVPIQNLLQMLKTREVFVHL